MNEEKKCPILHILTEKWRSNLTEKYGKSFSVYIEIAIEFLKKITDRFYELELNDNHFESEILSKDKYKYEQRMSEIIFSNRLEREGYSIQSNESGPDFKAVKNGNITWFEVITPTPDNELLEQFEDRSYALNPTHEGNSMRERNTLLKMTSAVQAKYKKIHGYINKGIIKENEAVIIVVNDSLLFPLSSRMIGLSCDIAKGCSGLPLVVEALLGVGQSYWQPDESGTNYQMVRSERPVIHNNNNAEIETNRFLTEKYSDISGVFVLTLREDYGLAETIYTHPRHKQNRGQLLTNPNTSRVFKTSDLSAYVIDHDEIKKLLKPSKERPIRNSITKTTTGYYLDMINYLNRLRELLFEAGILIEDKETGEVTISEYGLSVGIDNFELVLDDYGRLFKMVPVLVDS
ncbi:hypothetical protein ACAX60_004633 [Serratia marcescens]